MLLSPGRFETPRGLWGYLTSPREKTSWYSRPTRSMRQLQQSWRSAVRWAVPGRWRILVIPGCGSFHALFGLCALFPFQFRQLSTTACLVAPDPRFPPGSPHCLHFCGCRQQASATGNIGTSRGEQRRAQGDGLSPQQKRQSIRQICALHWSAR